MKRLFITTVILSLMGYLLAACASMSTQSSPTPISEAKVSPASSKPQWEHKWNTILEAAKKEGTVTMYTNWVPEARTAILAQFKTKYGINVEFSTFGWTAETLSKILAEKRAGLDLVDVIGGGFGILPAKQEGILGKIQPLLVRPEVSDPNAWQGKELPFFDKDGTLFALTWVLQRPLVYNSDVIREGEITSYKELLKPQYKGKIVFMDPTIVGSTNSLMRHLGTNLWNEAESIDFLRKLIKEQKVVIERDYRILIESVARSKYPIGVGPNTPSVPQFVAMGAPIKSGMLKEDTLLLTSSGCLAVSAKLAHPNAAIIFVNWLLSEEGVSLVATTTGAPGTRTDASTKGIYPPYIPNPSEKLYREDETAVPDLMRWAQITKNTINEN